MSLNDCVKRALLYAGLLSACLFSVVAPALAAVHAGDQLQVTVYSDPDLSRSVVVDSGDFISLPLAGNVSVHGLEPKQIAARVELALGPYFKTSPDVGVELTSQAPSLFIAGGPGGVLKFQPGETLIAALAELPAGASAASQGPGLQTLEHSRIDLHRVGIERNGAQLGVFDALALSSYGEGGPELRPGDTISLVDKPNVVHVVGEVVNPGETYLAGDESLADALTQAGGLKDTSATAEFVLQRGGTTQTLALGDAAFREPAQNGDILTVPLAPVVSVVGMVNKPGTVALKSNFTLLNALYQAGGPAKWANLTSVQLMHEGTTTNYNIVKLSHGDTSQNPVLTNGDLVFVPEGHKVDFSTVLSALSPVFSVLYLFPHP